MYTYDKGIEIRAILKPGLVHREKEKGTHGPASYKHTSVCKRHISNHNKEIANYPKITSVYALFFSETIIGNEN